MIGMIFKDFDKSVTDEQQWIDGEMELWTNRQTEPLIKMQKLRLTAATTAATVTTNCKN